MPIIKVLLAHKKTTIAVAALSFALAEVVVRPAHYVGFKNYPKVCKEFYAIRKSGLTVEQQMAMKKFIITQYHNTK